MPGVSGDGGVVVGCWVLPGCAVVYRGILCLLNKMGVAAVNQIHPQYLVDADGNPKSVLLQVDEFNELLECAQDVLDGQEIDALREEPTVSWEEVKAAREAAKR